MSEPSTKKRKLTLPSLTRPADPVRHVFIPLHASEAKIPNLFGEERAAFIRAPVAAGKTTTALHLAAQFPQEYVKVPFTNGTEVEWRNDLLEAIQKSCPDFKGTSLADALKHVAGTGLTLVFDEAHSIFAHDSLCTLLFKRDEPNCPRVLLFSAAAEAASTSGELMATPSGITKKFIWVPPMPNASDLKEPLAQADIKLDVKSIEFFLRFCAGHRGIFMAVMHWVLKMQQEEPEGRAEWTLGTTVGRVRSSYGNEDWDSDGEILSAVSKCRAVKVNGPYADINKIPDDFAQLLCEGPMDVAFQSRKRLTVAGFILPEVKSQKHEFQDLDWSIDGTKYRVANPFLAMYYRRILQKRRGLEIHVDQKPTSCADMLLRVIPYLTFAKVTSYPPPAADSPLSRDGLPYEQQYTSAMINVFQKLNFKADCPHDPSKGLGKVDCFVELDGGVLYAMETIMASRDLLDHKKHLDRFSTMENYKRPRKKALITIGNLDKVHTRVEQMQDVIAHRADMAGVEIIGLAPNIAHTAYTVIVNGREFFVDCDLVSRGLVTTENKENKETTVQLCFAQQFKGMNPAASGQGAEEQQPTIVWVQPLEWTGKAWGPHGSFFQVKDNLANIDDVKKAIKKEMELTIASPLIDIYQHAGENWEKVQNAATPVSANDPANPLGYVLPSGQPA